MTAPVQRIADALDAAGIRFAMPGAAIGALPAAHIGPADPAAVIESTAVLVMRYDVAALVHRDAMAARFDELDRFAETVVRALTRAGIGVDPAARRHYPPAEDPSTLGVVWTAEVPAGPPLHCEVTP